MKNTLFGAIAIASTLAVCPALAEEHLEWPYIEGELSLEFETDSVSSSDDPTLELVDSYVTFELGFTAHLNEIFSVNVGLVLEPVLDPLPMTDRFLEDHGLYAEVLNLQIDHNDTSIVIGKFGPGFGLAWDYTPGVYGVDLAEDYELAEFLGFGIAHMVGLPTGGSVTFGFNAFTADTTFLSNSLITERGQTRRADGGAGNTGKLDNFSVTVDGKGGDLVPGLMVHVAVRSLGAGVGDFDREFGVALGARKEWELADNKAIALIGEVVILKNAFAGPDTVRYGTLGAEIAHGPWHGEIAGTMRRTAFAAGGQQHDFLYHASAGHTWENGVDLSLGYAITRDANVDAHIIGFVVSKAIEFKFGS
ncbi:MAG: hypothetical protein JKY32_13765 [Rhizobiales bacterium]|nr:hypothetical protein [Hyphomicrobiales bacterium]